MKKRKEVMDSGSSDDEESSKSSDEESKTSKKRNKSPHTSDSQSGSDEKNVSKKARRMTHSSSSSDDSNDDASDKEDEVVKVVPVPAVLAPSHVQPQAPASDGNKSDLEEGQLSSESEGTADDNDEDESSSNSEFSDGYGEDLMGNEIDRNQLEKLSEKERETELFKRAERRDQLKRRWEIERKLKQSRKVENAKNKTFKKPASKKPKTPAAKKMIEKIPKAAPYSSSIVEDGVSAASHLFTMPSEEPVDPDKMDDDYREEYFDPKERSKERKKNVEMNKTDDKRSSAMAQLKAVSFVTYTRCRKLTDFSIFSGARESKSEKLSGSKSLTRKKTSTVSAKSLHQSS